MLSIATYVTSDMFHSAGKFGQVQAIVCQEMATMSNTGRNGVYCMPYTRGLDAVVVMKY